MIKRNKITISFLPHDDDMLASEEVRNVINQLF